MKTRQNNALPAGDAAVLIARLFLGRPYQAQTLDGAGREKLTVNVSVFDCLTFVETVLALARCARLGKLTPAAFKKNLKFIRYRGGKIQGYASRLHYFTDWLRDNENKGVLADATGSLGGKPSRKKIDFMTTHLSLYPWLKNPVQLSEIMKVEKSLSRRTIRTIPRNQVGAVADKIQNGDIIAFTARQPGLDVAHVGFALREGKSLRLLHASQKDGRVSLSGKTLAAYLRSREQFTGVMIARPL
ncbi:MAG TPA: DUF1460 domain-containing protein [Smithella sp.]|nr:DUF1460 domain-containing protein [Smithella sp.]HRS97005.1 DUF1460 domain-containing protein [Smithella sp.]